EDDDLVSIRASTDDTILAVALGDGTAAGLYASDVAVFDARVAGLYGLEAEDSMVPRELPDERVAGLLTQAEWLNGNPSPATRGNGIVDRLLCLSLGGDDAIEPVREAASSDTTRREEYLASVEAAPCWGCHQYMAPTGLTLEHFDASGRYRTKDNG